MSSVRSERMQLLAPKQLAAPNVTPIRRPRPPAMAPIWSLVVASVLSVSLRLRMYWTPITADEAGFLVIARSWAHGRTLYRDVWVDRPQGLIAVYRFWDWASGGSVASLRIMAMLFGVVLVVATASVATQIAGRSAGSIAAVLVAALTANPAIEGHLANGELLAGAVAVTGLAIGVRAIVDDRPGLLVLSGIVAGLALSLKQSGFEGIGALLVWSALAPRSGWRTRRESIRDMAALALGVSVVCVALAIQGSAFGLSRWWYAVATHRLADRSALSGAMWGRLWSTFLVAGPILLPVAMVCVLALCIRRSPTGAPIRLAVRIPHLLGIWASVVAVSFLLGGNFFRHYWLTWCPMLSVSAAVCLVRLMTRRVAMLAAIALLLPGLLAAAAILQLSSARSGAVASNDPRLEVDQPLAAWFTSVRAPGDHLYVMCAGNGFYADAGVDPQVPFLWLDHVHMYPGAIERIADLLTGEGAPRYIALYQPTDRCDPSGRLNGIVQQRYAHETTVAGVEVLERTTT